MTIAPTPDETGYPLYQQLINACGLTTVLMILHHSNYHTEAAQLDLLCEHLDPLINEIEPDLPSEFQLQYVLQYVLLKIYGAKSVKYQFLKPFFKDAFPQEFFNHLTIVKYQMKQNQRSHLISHLYQNAEGYDQYFLDDYQVNANFLQEQAHYSKMDLDLKLLLWMFGFKFLPQQNQDGTGALSLNYTSEKEYVKHITNYFLSPDHHLICGKSAHWMLVVHIYPRESSSFFKFKERKEGNPLEQVKKASKLKDITLLMNNPLKNAPQEYNLEDIGQDFRFYIFEKSNPLPEQIWNQFLDRIKDVLPLEIKSNPKDVTDGVSTFDPFN